MEPGTTWVERDSDGRLYFVRKKLKLPSTRSLLVDALASKRRSFSLFRNPGKDFPTMSAPVSTPLSFPARTTESSISRSTAPVMLPSQPRSVMYPLPYPTLYLAPPQTSQENRAPSGQQHLLDHAPQYRFAPPGMYSPEISLEPLSCCPASAVRGSSNQPATPHHCRRFEVQMQCVRALSISAIPLQPSNTARRVTEEDRVQKMS